MSKLRRIFRFFGIESGGIDLIQFLVAMIIIGTAAVSVTFSLYIGRGALDSEWRRKRALEIARDEVEYLTAFIYEGQGGVAVPEPLLIQTITHQDTIDFMGEEFTQPVLCKVIREPLEFNQILFTGTGLESYKIKVKVVWEESCDNPDLDFPPDTVKLESWMIHNISG